MNPELKKLIRSGNKTELANFTVLFAQEVQSKLKPQVGSATVNKMRVLLQAEVGRIAQAVLDEINHG
jgi:hypothetical protein